MNKLIIVLLGIVSFCFSRNDNSTDPIRDLKEAYHAHDYFKLDRLVNQFSQLSVKTECPEIMLYKAKLNYVFNKSFESDSIISILLKYYLQKFNDTIKADLYYMMAINEERLENYKKSFEMGTLVVAKYSNFYDTSFISELKDDNEIRLILSNVPKMEITRENDVQIKIKRDIAGLLNIPVILGADSMNFVFDTGAGMPVIVNSLAQKYGFKPLKGKVNILAITGKRIQADLALVNLKIGNLNIRNSPFIVFPDSVLSFANGAYVIRGVIGFPIMRALGELIFQKDQDLIIPKVPEKTKVKNFALDDQTPVILVVYKNDSLPFHFDTGADKTILYPSFLSKYNTMIMNECVKKTQKLGGAGGSIDIESYILKKALFTAGNQTAELDTLNILTKSFISVQNKYFYGNFGQDFIKQYNEMKINFTEMNISFSR